MHIKNAVDLMRGSVCGGIRDEEERFKDDLQLDAGSYNGIL